MPNASLYRRALGVAYDRQSRAGQILHDTGTKCWKGRCSVEGGATAAARLIAWLFRLPAAATDAPISVAFAERDDGEIWTRRLGRRAMRSRQFIDRHKPSGWIVEQFGVFAFDLELQVRAGRLGLMMRGMRCFGVPLPEALWPRIVASKSEEQGRFCFDVEIGLPAAGRLVRYRGWLTDR